MLICNRTAYVYFLYRNNVGKENNCSMGVQIVGIEGKKTMDTAGAKIEKCVFCVYIKACNVISIVLK